MLSVGSSSACLHQHGHHSAAASATLGRKAAQQPQCECHHAQYWSGSSGRLLGSFGVHAGNREVNLAELQQVNAVPLLLPALGSGRIARSEQLKQRALAKVKAQGSKRRATVNIAKLLTNQIAAAASLEQLHEILAAHGNYLDHIHVAKLLSRTSQLTLAAAQQQQQQAVAPGTSQQQHQQPGDPQLDMQGQQHQQRLLFTQLIAMMVQRLRHATAQSLVAAVAALGRVSSIKQAGSSNSSSTGENGSSSSSIPCASPEQLQQLAGRAAELAPEMKISQLVVVLWGLAKAGHKPDHSSGSTNTSSSKWLEQMLAAVMQQYTKAHERQQKQQQQQQRHQQKQVDQQSGSAMDDPRLQRPVMPRASKQQQQSPFPPQLDPLYCHPQQHTLATDLALVLYAVAVIGLQPSAAWLAQWQQAVLQQLPSANAQDISQLLWSLSSLGLVPDVAWLHQVLAAAEPLLASAGSHAASNMAWALAGFNQALPQGWIKTFLEAVQQDQTLAGNPQAASSLLASLARLKAPVESSKLSSMLEQITEHLPAYNPWQLTNLVWACASFNAKPSAAWTKQFLRCTAKLADGGKFTVNQLASILWSLAVLRRTGEGLLPSQQLQVQVMLNALAAANNARGFQQLGAAGRSGLVWALAALSVGPSRPWLAQYLAAAFSGGLAADQVRCANVLFCVASLDSEYLVEWLGEFLEGEGEGEGAVAGGLDLSLEKYAALVTVLTALSEMDSRQLRAAWLDISTTDWSPEAAPEGSTVYSLQLPPALSTWVDHMLLASAAPAAQKAPHKQLRV